MFQTCSKTDFMAFLIYIQSEGGKHKNGRNALKVDGSASAWRFIFIYTRFQSNYSG